MRNVFFIILAGIIFLWPMIPEDVFGVPPMERVKILDGMKILDIDGTETDTISAGQQILVAAPSFTAQTPTLKNAPFGCAEKIVEGDKIRCIGYTPTYQFVQGDKLLGVDESRYAQHAVCIIQITDEKGTVVSLSWIEGILKPEHVLEPKTSWIPEKPGTYSVVVFFWESVNNPTALAPPTEMEITVQ